MPTKAAPYYTVISSFSTNVDGVDETYLAGEIVPADDPAIKRLPEAFSPLIVRGAQAAEPEPEPEPRKAEAPVERATAAPGEKRETGGKAMTNEQLKGRSH